MKLREYQIVVKNTIHDLWDSGVQNICVQMATGAGKTVLFSKIAQEHKGYVLVVAHRIELVSQISVTLAKYGVKNAIVAQKQAIREIVNLHLNELKKSFYDPKATCIVAAVDTLLRLSPKENPWMSQISLLIQDEGHHTLRSNKWGKVAKLFSAAKGLYPTATPIRADGNGLGRHADGVIDKLVLGPSMRSLITRGFLTDYRIISPSAGIDLTQIPLSASGDFSPAKLRIVVKESRIVGDVVKHYLRFASGKLGITFAVDIESAAEIAKAFNEAGVCAEVITSKTPAALRADVMRRFRKREVMQIVNVDLLGEGVDVPAIEVVSMARPTESFALYSQQFGRALRPMPNKSHAIIIDHVDNVLRHGLPDATFRTWNLDRRDRKARKTPDGIIPLKTCLNEMCMAVYEKTKRECPHCGHYSPPAERSTPDQVEGDLIELSAEALARLRGEIARVDSDPHPPQHVDAIVHKAICNRHKERQEAQEQLRETIARWAGVEKHNALPDSEIYRKFYFLFGVDILTAQTLGTKDATALMEKIKN